MKQNKAGQRSPQCVKEILEKRTFIKLCSFEMFVKVCSKVNKMIKMYFPRSIQLKNVKCGSHDRPETIACKTFSFSFYIERMFYVLHGCTLGFFILQNQSQLCIKRSLWIKDLILSEIFQLCFK